MDKFLKFMDFSCIDPSLYWKIPTRDGAELYEIQWRRVDKFRWRLRKLGEVLWELSHDDAILNQLETLDIDTELFETKLKSTLLQQVTYADCIVSDARQLFGTGVIDEAVNEQKTFLAQLEEAIASLTLLPAPARPKLRVIKDTADIIQA